MYHSVLDRQARLRAYRIVPTSGIIPISHIPERFHWSLWAVNLQVGGVLLLPTYKYNTYECGCQAGLDSLDHQINKVQAGS